MYSENRDKAKGRRKASKKIMQNRGLTRFRRKDIKNPRVHQRVKYKKALQKRRHQVKEFQGYEHDYGGERGIKPSLIKSVTLAD